MDKSPSFIGNVVVGCPAVGRLPSNGRISNSSRQEKPGGMPDNVRQNKPGRMPDNVSQDKPGHMPDNVRQDKPGHMPDNVAQGKPNPMLENVRKDKPGHNPGNVKQEKPGHNPDNVKQEKPGHNPDNVKQEKPGHNPGSVSQGKLDDIHENVKQEKTGRICNGVRQKKPSAVRDFPPGCGRYAKVLENGIHPGNLAVSTCSIVKDEGEASRVEEQVLQKSSEVITVQVQGHQISRSEIASKCDVLESEAALPPKMDSLVSGNSAEAAIVEVSERLTHKTEESPKCLENSEAPARPEGLAPPVAPATPPVETMNERVGTDRGKRRVSARRDFPPHCGRNASLLSQGKSYEITPLGKQEVRKVQNVAQPMDSKAFDSKDTKLGSELGKIFQETQPREGQTAGNLAAKFEKVSGNKEIGSSQKVSVKIEDMDTTSKFSAEDHQSIYGNNEASTETLSLNMDERSFILEQSEHTDNETFTYREQDFTGLEVSSDDAVVRAPTPAVNHPSRSGSSLSMSKKRFSRSSGDEQGIKKRKLASHPTARRNVDGQECSSSSRGTVTLIPLGVPDASCRRNTNESEEIVTRKMVRETLRLFQACCRKFLQEEESKAKGEGQGGGRIDYRVSNILKEKGRWVNTGKQILGNVPGVEVGDEFRYRVELALIGLHRQYMAGIDYLNQKGKLLATSIVASGGYNDDIDNSDILIYSGHGGNPSGPDKKQTDQKLERGNLALKNSMDVQTPVRVIRGVREAKAGDAHDRRSKTVVTYTYDGLYLVERYWMEKEHHGCLVFKFQLKRIQGQPELAIREVKKSKKLATREGLCIQDISEGQERIPICAVNTISDEKPLPFKYTKQMIYPSWYEPHLPEGCDCVNGCSDSTKCICVLRNGGEIPFNYDGAIVEAKPLVFECGPACKCPPNCHNRVSQHGIRFQLEVFKTESRGWGVRSLTSIPSGSFICEYVGELLQEAEAEQRTGNDEYLFDIGQNYSSHSLWGGVSTIMPEICGIASCEMVENTGFTIDAAEYGNVGRFINHSCSPNLYAQNVLYDHDDKRIPHIMLFAAENIPPLQELTYHYNYKIDTVHDADGNIKRKSCYCGSQDCVGRLY